MPREPLTDLPPDEQDVPLTLAIAWSEAVVRQIAVAQSAQTEYNNAISAADRADDWSPTDDAIHERFRNMWTSHSTLVWMSFQLEKWNTRLHAERNRDVPPSVPLLRELRNTLEHLDEAILCDFCARPGADPKANRSLRELPDSELPIGSHGKGSKLFGLVALDEIEQTASHLLNAIAAEIDEYCADRYADLHD